MVAQGAHLIDGPPLSRSVFGLTKLAVAIHPHYAVVAERSALVWSFPWPASLVASLESFRWCFDQLVSSPWGHQEHSLPAWVAPILDWGGNHGLQYVYCLNDYAGMAICDAWS